MKLLLHVIVLSPQDLTLAFLKVQFVSHFFCVGCTEPILFDTGTGWHYCLRSGWKKKATKKLHLPPWWHFRHSSMSPPIQFLTVTDALTNHSKETSFHVSISLSPKASLQYTLNKFLCMKLNIIISLKILSCSNNLSTFAQRCCNGWFSRKSLLLGNKYLLII